MAKPIIFQKSKKGLIDKIATENYYRSRFFSNFMNKFEITGMSDDQMRFFLTQLWEVGTISAFILKESRPASLVLEAGAKESEGELVLTPYAPSLYNIYNYPTRVTLVRLRGANFIPQTPQIVGKDVVLCWAHTSHMPIRYLVDFYVDKIAEVEATISTNLFAHKLPRLIVVSPEDKERMTTIVSKIEKGESALFLDAEDYNAIKNVLDAGGSYIIDKLYVYKQNLENELLTILGIDNKGSDKKERLIVDEVNANNDIINQGSDCFMVELDKFVKQVKDILGYTITIKSKEVEISSIYDEEQPQEETPNDPSEN